MCCRGFLAVALGVAVFTPAARAQKNFKERDAFELSGVALVNGELRAKKDDESVWVVRKTPQGTLVVYYSQQNERGPSGWQEWYLNYDHKGKDGRVGLVPQPGPGCYWQWDRGPRVRESREGYDFDCTARPLNGPLLGSRLAIKGDWLVLTNAVAKEIQFRGFVENLDDGR